MANISRRVSIRWPPKEASEPTSTIVLTTPQRRFVDVRLLLQPSPLSGHGPLALDWAFAGHSSSNPLPEGQVGEAPARTHSVWRHWVDSRTPDAEGVVDEGDMVPLEDGTTLETGVMVNPATGMEGAYEEVWEDIEPLEATTARSSSPDNAHGGQAVKVVVLQLQDDAAQARGVVIRLGQFCQGILRVGEDVTVERWQRDDGTAWTAPLKIGNSVLPCPVAVDERRSFEVGEAVEYGDWTWKVVEVHG